MKCLPILTNGRQEFSADGDPEPTAEHTRDTLACHRYLSIRSRWRPGGGGNALPSLFPMFGSSRFQAVLHYYSGFTKLANLAIRDFVSTYARQKSSIKDLLPLLHCFYEVQEPSLCKLVFTRECIELNSALSPVDYLAIGYFVTSLLSVPSSDTSNILLKIKDIVDKHRLKLLLLELSKYPIGEANERRLEIHVTVHINRCSHQLFEGLQHNSALVRLHLSNTGLVATEDTAQALTTMLQVNKTLTHLDLSWNWKFSDSGACCVFQSLQHNTTLVHLNLSNTGLVAIEDTAQALTTMLQINKTLTHLDLSNNEKFLRAYCVVKGLQHNTALVHLNLSNTGLVATEDTAQALTTMLQVNKTLTHLDLSWNWKFSDSGACCVFQSLQHNTTLVHLNLSNTGLVAIEDTAQALTTMLQINKTLTHLDLSNNEKFLRAYCVVKGLQHNTALVHLNLSNTGLVATEDTAQALTTMLQINKTLTHLDLSNNEKFLRAYCVVKGLQHNTALVHLNLSNTGLVATEDTAQALTTMLQINKTLTHLDLSNNEKFSESRVYCVVKGLQHNTALVHLNLSNTGLVATEDTAQALTTMLKVSKTIKHLNLSVNCAFSEAGAYCVCQGLQHNTSLAYLNLSRTEITDNGAEYIAQAIESNCSLQTLDISKNIITDNGFACIDKSLKTNTTLSLHK